MFFETQAAAFNGSGGPLTPGFIGSNALVGVNAGSITSDGFIDGDILTTNGGHIVGNASVLLNATGGDINGTQGIAGVISLSGGGKIDASALVVLNAQNIITVSTATGTPGVDTMALEASIYPNVNGTVGGDALVSVQAAQDITAPGKTLFWVANGNYQNLGPGTITGNAEVDVSATNISTGDLLLQILNYGGSSIGGNAEVNVTTTNLSVNGSLDSRIDNTGGTIGGHAVINMNVSGTAKVTNDATVQILGDNPTGSAAINFNGGSYDVSGTFLSSIDGTGAITLNKASLHADVLKVGALGPNGVLNIGVGTLAADTTLKLYAGGSSGAINFTADVTLGGNSTKILAADSVTIFNGVTVTIAGPNRADVYTNNANYARSDGGNGSTSGTFAGGANNPQPLRSAPLFDSPSTRVATRSTRTSAAVIHVTDSSQLSSLLDNAAPGPNGKIRISPNGRSHNQSVRGSTRMMAAKTELHRSVDARARSGVLATHLQ